MKGVGAWQSNEGFLKVPRSADAGIGIPGLFLLRTRGHRAGMAQENYTEFRLRLRAQDAPEVEALLEGVDVILFATLICDDAHRNQPPAASRHREREGG